MKFIFRITIVLSLFILIPGSVGFTAEQPADETQQEEFVMDEVVVTATKTAEKRKDVSNAVITKDAPDIRESTARSLGELLANEPGIDWRTYGGYGGAPEMIHIRGMGADGTQVFVNGINVNLPSVGTADTARIPLASIDRVEIVKGAGSLLYGSGAMGGTVNIITKSPRRDGMDFKVLAGYGTQNTYQLAVENGMYVTEAFGYYLTAGRKETDGFRDNSGLTHNDVSLKLLFDKGPLFQVSAYGDHIDREFGRPGVEPPPGTRDFYAGGVRVYSSDAASTLDEGSDEDSHLALEVSSAPVDWLSLKLRGDYSHAKNYNLTRYYDAWTVGTVPGSKTWTTNQVSTVEGTAEVKPFAGASVLFGADYKGYDWKNETVDLNGFGIEDETSRTSVKAHLFTRGAFAEAQYRPLKYVKALAGIRHEHHSTYGGEDVPRFGLIINPLEITTIKLSHGKHYKAPTPNDLFWPYEDWGWGMGAQGNINLRPETGWHTDATLEQSLFDNKVFLTFSMFRWNIDDKIQWIPDASFFYRPQNVAQYEATGFETGLKVGPYYNTTLALNYTKLNAKEQKQNGLKRPALNTPENQFKGVLTYSASFGLTATATATFVGTRPGYYANDSIPVPAKKLPDYWTVDMKLEQRLFKHWLLTLQGNNLFNQGYETYAANFYDASGVGTLSSFPGAGRSVFASVAYEF